ncbi:MAG TPA: hypothetical protein VIJ94_03560, partial [Caulobacteraceae bacterium]
LGRGAGAPAIASPTPKGPAGRALKIKNTRDYGKAPSMPAMSPGPSANPFGPAGDSDQDGGM